MAKIMFHETFTYGKYNNCYISVTGKDRYPQRLTPPPPEWVKYNTEQPKIEKQKILLLVISVEVRPI